MNGLSLPWLEISLALPLVGAALAARVRNPSAAFTRGTIVSALTLVATLLAAASFYADPTRSEAERRLFAVDSPCAPMLPTVALLHLIVALGTTRTKMARFSAVWLLVAETIALATLSCQQTWPLLVLLGAGAALPYAEPAARRLRSRTYFLYLLLFGGLLAAGGALAAAERSQGAALCWVAASLVRSGVLPFHAWVAPLFGGATFGAAKAVFLPLPGVLAALRLALPLAPDSLLEGAALLSLATAVYAGGLAAVQHDMRRFYAYLCLSQSSLALFGALIHSPGGLTAALCLWIAAMVSLAGLGFSLRALEARFGSISMREHQGFHEQTPLLALCFLFTGLSSVGFPGTLGFVPTELLVSGSIERHFGLGAALVVAATVNGIAVLRAYFLLFTGKRVPKSVALGVTPRERLALLLLALALFGGGLFPQPGILSRHAAAERLLAERPDRLSDKNQ